MIFELSLQFQSPEDLFCILFISGVLQSRVIIRYGGWLTYLGFSQ